MSQWEYCVVRLVAAVVRNVAPDGSPETSYECGLEYIGFDGKQTYRSLASLERRLQYNPFEKALGVLGGAGWELVSVQHGIVPFDDSRIDGMPIGGTVRAADNAIAYLKRPVEAGRAVDEPKLEWE